MVLNPSSPQEFYQNKLSVKSGGFFYAQFNLGIQKGILFKILT